MVMISRDNVVSLSGQKLGGQRMTLDTQTTSLVADCRLMLGDSLRRLLQAMFDRLDDALYETADKAESHNVQFRYLDAMRDMRKQRASIEAVLRRLARDESIISRVDRSHRSRWLIRYPRVWQTLLPLIENVEATGSWETR